MHTMALSPQPDIRFLRNTGLALVTATLLAGTMMLSLALTESKPVIIANSADLPANLYANPTHVAAAGSAVSPIPTSPYK
jgi:hypothetical protein